MYLSTCCLCFQVFLLFAAIKPQYFEDNGETVNHITTLLHSRCLYMERERINTLFHSFPSSLLYQSLGTHMRMSFRLCACWKGVSSRDVPDQPRPQGVHVSEGGFPATRLLIAFLQVSLDCKEVAHSLSAFANGREKSSLAVKRYVS
jgi:hypothetical protein